MNGVLDYPVTYFVSRPAKYERRTKDNSIPLASNTTDIFPRCGVSLVQVPLESSQKNTYMAISQGVKAIAALKVARASFCGITDILRYYHAGLARLLGLSAWATEHAWNENIAGVTLYSRASD